VFEKALRDSVAPFAAEYVNGVKTHRGVKHGVTKPSGRYTIISEEALVRRRLREIELFQAMLEASAETEQFFAETFSEEEVDGAISGLRYIKSAFNSTLMGVGS
jgi:hypothetical protein